MVNVKKENEPIDITEAISVLSPEVLAHIFGEQKLEIPVISKLVEAEEFVQRKLYLTEEIGMSEGEVISTAIRRYNEVDERNKIPVKKREPIKIYINSYGGSVTCGMQIIDAIRLSKTPVHTIVTGIAYSMAGMVLMAGHKRIAYPSATFLLHDGSIHIGGDTSKARDHLDFSVKYDNEILKPIIMKRTKITEKEYKEKTRVEWFMIASEMLDYGIIDQIAKEF